MPKKAAADSAITERPRAITRFIRLDDKLKRLTALHKEAKAEADEVLKLSTFDDIYRMKVERKRVDEEKAIRWLRKQVRAGKIDRDTYKGCFVRLFDPNRFVELIRTRKTCKSALPKGIIISEVSYQVRRRKGK